MLCSVLRVYWWPLAPVLFEAAGFKTVVKSGHQAKQHLGSRPFRTATSPLETHQLCEPFLQVLGRWWSSFRAKFWKLQCASLLENMCLGQWNFWSLIFNHLWSGLSFTNKFLHRTSIHKTGKSSATLVEVSFHLLRGPLIVLPLFIDTSSKT